MICLYCGKQIDENASNSEKKEQWHKKCIHAFFGTDQMPSIDVNKQELEHLVRKTVKEKITVPGVQKKLSLHLSDDASNPKLTIIDHPTGYILKPQSADYIALPEAEHFVMKLASLYGIQTVPCTMIKLHRQSGVPYAYITKRVDRINSGKYTGLLAMEDFCQLSMRTTADKYKSSYENVAKIIKKYSSRPAVDLSELYIRLLFCYLTGNSDMHLKNFSLIENHPGERKYVLSPAYDLLPVNVILPEDKEETALTLNGKKQNIRRNDFLKYAETIGINKSAAVKMMERMLTLHDKSIQSIDNSFMPENMKNDMKSLMDKRFTSLKG